MSMMNKEAFLRQAKAAQAAAPAGGGGFKKADNSHTLKISKELGGFLWAPDPAKPKDTTYLGKSIRGIIVRSAFGLIKWVEGQKKPVCKSVSYHEQGSNQIQKGQWMIPFNKELSISNYSPNGLQGRTCAECVAQNMDDGCDSKGSIDIVVYYVDGKKLDQPFLGTIEPPLTSQIEYQNYVVRTLLEDYDFASPDEMVTQLDIQTATSEAGHSYKKIVYTPMGRVEDAHKQIVAKVTGTAPAESTSSTASAPVKQPAPAPAAVEATTGGGEVEDLPF